MTAAPSLARQTAVGATWMVAWRMVTRALGLLSTLALARLLVPADFGLIAMATTFSAAIDALSELGLKEALIRRPQEDRALFDVAFTLQVGRAGITALLTALGAPLIGGWFHEPRLLPVLLILAAGSAVAGCENIGIVEFRRNMDYGVQFKLLLLPRLSQVAVTVVFALVLQNYWALLLGIIWSKLSRTAMTYFVHPYRPRLTMRGWRELAGFSFWTWASCVVAIVWDRCDPFVLGPRIGPAQLGLYLLALEVATLPVTELVIPAADVLFAGFAAAQKRGGQSIGLALSVASMMLLIVVPTMITISCASGNVVALLLGPRWLAAQKLIAVLTWLCTFSPFSWICGVALVANGHVRQNFFANAIVSAVKLVGLSLTVLLTDRLDRIALASTVIVATESATFVYFLLRAGAEPARLAWGLMRIALSGVIALSAVVETGLAWQTAPEAGLSTIWTGVAIAGTSFAGFGFADFGLWLLAGRPAGPERLLWQATAARVIPVRRR